jgi:chemotaxis protein MotB
VEDPSQINNPTVTTKQSPEKSVPAEPEIIMDAFEGMFSRGEQNLFGQTGATISARGLWAIVWSDLMMTMFVLFAVLFIYEVAKRPFRFGGTQTVTKTEYREKKSTPSPKETSSPERPIIFQMELTGSEQHPSETVRLKTMRDLERMQRAEDQAVRIVLPADLLFDTGRADIKPQAEKSLHEVAQAIQNTDDMINVVGHTDDVPIHSDQFATNWELSAMRACKVSRFLIEQEKIPAERFFVSGYSYFQPLSPNVNAENRQSNRRVEIILSKKKPIVSMNNSRKADGRM